MYHDQNEKKGISNEEDKPSGAVFNALDAMLKGSLDRLKTMRFVLLILIDCPFKCDLLEFMILVL